MSGRKILPVPTVLSIRPANLRAEIASPNIGFRSGCDDVVADLANITDQDSSRFRKSRAIKHSKQIAIRVIPPSFVTDGPCWLWFRSGSRGVSRLSQWI